MSPLISIIVPVYNVEKFIHKCVDSIINQTYKNIEIILIDDGSPDNCGSICDEYSLRDNRVRVVHQKNGGTSKAKNTGLSIAKGQYIAFVDSDDYIEKNMFELLLNAALADDSQIAICNFRKSNSQMPAVNSQDYNSKVLDTKETFINYLNYGFYVWRNLYNSNVLDELKFKEDILFTEDIIFGAEILSKINKSTFVNLPLYNYNTDNQSSLTRVNYNEKKFTSLKANLFLRNKAITIFPNDLNLHNLMRQRILKNCLFHLQNLYENRSLDKNNDFKRLVKRTYNENFSFFENKSLFSLINRFLGLELLGTMYRLQSMKHKLLKSNS